MKIFGSIDRPTCPVCSSNETEETWKIPFARLPEPVQIGGGRVPYFPSLDSEFVYRYCRCRTCESVYLNPIQEAKGHGPGSVHYIESMKAPERWRPFETRYDLFRDYFKPDDSVMVDAACGIGPYLTIAKKRADRQWRRLIALEISNNYVEHMKSIGLEAHRANLEGDDLTQFVDPDSVDFLIFSEAFEHMENANAVMKKLVRLLKPSGRIFFSAQALGGGLPVRPAETIYINEHGLKQLSIHLGAEVLSSTLRAGRYLVVMEKN